MPRLGLLPAFLLAGACAKAPEPAASAPVAPDTAAIRTALATLADGYEAAEKAGDAAGIAALYTDDARTEFQGFPSAVGKAAILAQSQAAIAAQKVVEMEITTDAVGAPAPGLATGVGRATQTVEAAGKRSTIWWRYAAAYRQGADGQWRISFITGFADSTR